MPNLKSVALTILELLAFNMQNFRESRDTGHAPFLEKFSRGRILTVTENTHAKFEVHSFNRFGVISI